MNHPGGVVVRDEAEQPETGAWRTGVKPQVDLSRCVNCLLAGFADQQRFVVEGIALARGPRHE